MGSSNPSLHLRTVDPSPRSSMSMPEFPIQACMVPAGSRQAFQIRTVIGLPASWPESESHHDRLGGAVGPEHDVVERLPIDLEKASTRPNPQRLGSRRRRLAEPDQQHLIDRWASQVVHHVHVLAGPLDRLTA